MTGFGNSGFFRANRERAVVFPMEDLKIVVDDATQCIGIVLEKRGIEPPPAILLTTGQTISLIQGLRLALRDIEMLPPLQPFTPSSRPTSH